MSEMSKRTAVWTTAARKKVRVCDMETEHLSNTIAMIERDLEQGTGKKYMLDPERRMIPIYHEMVAELAERNTTPAPKLADDEKLIRQEVFVQGAMHATKFGRISPTMREAVRTAAKREAKTRWPIEPVYRPRVIGLGSYMFRVTAGKLEQKLRGQWDNHYLPVSHIPTEYIRELSDLLAHPLEIQE